MPTKIVISGASGRMGQTLATLIAADTRFALVGGIDEDHPASDDVIARSDVIIDFSAVAGLQSLLQRNIAGKALVVGTTGLTADVKQQLQAAAGRCAVLVAANFSVGVNLLLGLVEAAARVLDPEQYDVEIVEAHHSRKVDAPSGTALALGQAIAQARGTPLEQQRKDGRSGQVGARTKGEIGFHALRGGDIVGEHSVHFIGAHERIEIAHSAQDRGLFAEGALRAAAWIVGKPPGNYTMKDVLGLERR
jgi:4-hydroxy-tetrahydrodipicolinate reductase